MALVITLLVAGAILIVLETVLPGLIAGVIGFGCLLTAVIVAYSEFGAGGGNIVLLGVVVGLLIGTVAWVRYFPESRIARVFVSDRVIGNINADQPELLHQLGTALTPLRPCGTALINNRRVDVVTEGSMIDPGTPVKVVEIEGLRVVVRAIDPAELTPAPVNQKI